MTILAACGGEEPVEVSIFHGQMEAIMLRGDAHDILRKGQLGRDDDAALKFIIKALCEEIRSARRIDVRMNIDKSSMFADPELNRGFERIGCAQAIMKDGRGMVFSFVEDRWIPET